MKIIVVYTTTDNMDLARTIATTLISEREAGCVNIIPGIRSIYRWKGKICDEGEVLLVIKTVAERFESVRTRIKQLHTYQVPEVIALPVVEGDRSYLDWLMLQTGRGASDASSGADASPETP